MRGLVVIAIVVGGVGISYADPPSAKKPVATKQAAKMAKRKAAQPAWAARPRARTKSPQPVLAPARTLRAQGMTAYQAGNYNAAVRKFVAAMDAGSSPELIYQAAQAYRLKGERGTALELYERYLEVAPDGSAAPVCRWYVERLSSTP